MTNLEAAEVLLRELGPLHADALTRLAMERGLIAPDGKTPEATMRTELNRAVATGTSPFVKTEPNTFALASSAPRFTWIPFYEELADRLAAYRQRQPELISFLEGLRAKGLTITPLEGKDETGGHSLLKEIDPFTFFGVFNRGLTHDNRLRILAAMKEFFALSSPIPEDFDGIPVLNNQKSWFLGHRATRKEDVEGLWEVFVRALGTDPLNDTAFAKAFDRALDVQNVAFNLTMALFWIRPRRFVTLDRTSRLHLNLEIHREDLSLRTYQETIKKLLSSSQTPAELSLEAWKNADNPPSDDQPPEGEDAIDRQDPDVAKDRFEQLYPDPGERVGVAAFFGDVVDRIAKVGPARWGVTLRFSQKISVNVGKFLVCQLFSGHVWLALDPDLLTDADKAFLATEGLEVEDPGFRLQKRIRNIVIPAGKLPVARKHLWPAFEALVELAATTARQTPYAGSHSPGVLGYIAQELKRPMPVPSYEDVSGAGNSLSSTPAGDRQAAPDDSVDYWMVGAYWDSENPPDQTQRFLEEGIWENGYADKYLDVVRQMKPGDRIAIKATSTQRNNLPFANRGKTVSRLTIKARGKIVRNKGDGRVVDVAWEPKMEPRDWYSYTSRSTVWRLRKDEDLALRLRRFAFFDEPQDYELFANPSLVAEAGLDEGEAADVDVAQPYSTDDLFHEGVFLGAEEVALALRRLETKKLLVLQGPPGVGKTFVARKLAYAWMEARDDARCQIVQFHPSYTYEDFVRGYRPTNEAGKFELKDGPFMQICRRAQEDPDRKYVLIVDEINRGNLAQVFGELLMLLEADKRGIPLTPLYRRKDDERLTVPGNLYLIGTMNLADRSLALVDFALRRRFAFLELTPRFGASVFRQWLLDHKMSEQLRQRIIERMQTLNRQIAEDPKLGPAFQVGHSYFCPREGDFSQLGEPWYDEIVQTEIGPLLQEYWYDERKKADAAVEALLK